MGRKPKPKPRADGRYRAKLLIGKDADGKSIVKYFYSYISKADADRQRAEYVLSHPFADGTIAADPSCTLREWCDTWLISYKSSLAPNTKAQYRTVCNSICSFNGMGELRMSEFLPLHVAQYVNSLSGTSESNISIKRYVIRELFSAAVENGIIKSNPAAKLPKVSGTYEGHRALTRHEISIATTRYSEHRAGLLFMIMLWAGLRRGEALSLTWGDVDFFKRQLNVRSSLDIKHQSVKSTKTSAGTRVVPLFPPLYDALMQAHKPGKNAKQLVCTAASGKAYTESALNSAINSFSCFMERALNGIEEPKTTRGWRRDRVIRECESLGREWITFEFTPHDLRYTFATLCYDANVDVQTTKIWMGHRDIDTTMRIYTQLSNERKAQSTSAMDRFSAAFCSGEESVSDPPLTPLSVNSNS